MAEEDIVPGEEELWVGRDADEYCREACYHERLCRFGDCVDYECYEECVRNYHRG